jgi:hypothetical protein
VLEVLGPGRSGGHAPSCHQDPEIPGLR